MSTLYDRAMSRTILVALLFVVAALGDAPSAAAAEPYTADRYAPPPPSFDPRTVKVFGESYAPHGPGWRWTSALDGSGLQWEQPIDLVASDDRHA